MQRNADHAAITLDFCRDSTAHKIAILLAILLWIAPGFSIAKSPPLQGGLFNVCNGFWSMDGGQSARYNNAKAIHAASSEVTREMAQEDKRSLAQWLELMIEAEAERRSASKKA